MKEEVSSADNQQCSRIKRIVIVVVIIFLVLVITGIVLLVLACTKPCLFIRCHTKASVCINRSPFKAQCVCDVGTVGNGRTVCDECGIKYDPLYPRIIGGSDAISHSWPFAVLIRQRYKNIIRTDGKIYLVSSSWICGGTLINHKTILTAAHCLKTEGDTHDYKSNEYPIVWNKYSPNLESTLEVSVGVHDRRNQTEQRIVKVLQAIRHPLYNHKTLHNDIAIIKLDEYLQPSISIQFACLMDASSEVNTTGIVVGFGDTIPGANQGSNILQQVNLTIYPNDFCSNVSPKVRKNWDLQLCCGDLNGERDSCQGDSGGGLYVEKNLTDKNRYIIEGIVSYGEECASLMKPGIYTRISNYMDWIRENSDF